MDQTWKGYFQKYYQLFVCGQLSTSWKKVFTIMIYWFPTEFDISSSEKLTIFILHWCHDYLSWKGRFLVNILFERDFLFSEMIIFWKWNKSTIEHAGIYLLRQCLFLWNLEYELQPQGWYGWKGFFDHSIFELIPSNWKLRNQIYFTWQNFMTSFVILHIFRKHPFPLWSNFMSKFGHP